MEREKAYHHGHLKEELLRLGLEALERDGIEGLSLRALAEAAGVSKTAPYRHFPDKTLFLGALSNEGFRVLYGQVTLAINAGGDSIARMGSAFMKFAVERPVLYRLMNSTMMCSMPEEYWYWGRKALDLLGSTIAAALGGASKVHVGARGRLRETENGGADSDALAAAWAYMHGLVLLRIDRLFPAYLKEPDWERLAATLPGLEGLRPSGRGGGQGKGGG